MENVIIIGGGPAGLAAGIYLARARLSPLIFAGFPAGGQLMLTSEVENFPGFDSILGPELIEKMRNQVIKFGGRIIDQNVTKANLYITKKEVESDKKIYTAKALLIAVGASALWLGVPGEKELRGKGVSACAICDGFFFRNKVVGVVGGGDSAMEEALTLTKFAKRVYIIHRRDKFRASKIMQERVFKSDKISIIWNAVVEQILGNNKVEGVKLRIRYHQSEVKIVDLRLDGVFVAIGHKPDTDIFKDQIEIDEKGYIITSERLATEFIRLKSQDLKFKTHIDKEKVEELIKRFNLKYKTITSVEGAFAAGDCVDFEYRQAGTAAGMGIVSALEIERWLNDNY